MEDDRLIQMQVMELVTKWKRLAVALEKYPRDAQTLPSAQDLHDMLNTEDLEKNVHETLMVDGNGKDIELLLAVFTISTIYLHQLIMHTEIG